MADTIGDASPNQTSDYPNARYTRFPPGPPALWAMKQRQQDVLANAKQQDRLNQDPQYAAEYLALGHPPTVDESQSTVTTSRYPVGPLQQSFGPLSPSTQANVTQQSQTQALQSDYMQRLRMAMQGLRAL